MGGQRLVRRPNRWCVRMVGDMDGYFMNRGEEMPAAATWKLVAMIFAASLNYD